MICVLGDGAWGTTLALVLARKGFDVCLWGAFKENIEQIISYRENRAYLPGIDLPDKIRPVSDISRAIDGVEFIVLAIPSRFVKGVLLNIHQKGLSISRMCIAVKGMDLEEKKTMSELCTEIFPNITLAVLSGPAIAKEVALQQPTALVCASQDSDFALFLQEVFYSDYLRIYHSDDVIGVELGGSLKNVIAIAAGICDGLGFGTNTKAALLTRGIKEMARFIVARGGREATAYGISGLGDLMTTAFSPLSRNRSFGEDIAKGRDPKRLLQESKKAIEGAYTVSAVSEIADELGIDMPITRQVYSVIFESKSPTLAVKELMLRPLKQE